MSVSLQDQRNTVTVTGDSAATVVSAGPQGPAGADLPITGLDTARVPFGASASALSASANLTFTDGVGLDVAVGVSTPQLALTGGATINNGADEDNYSSILLRGGLTGDYRRYLQWQDYTGATVGYLGFNRQNSHIWYHSQGGVGGAGYHSFSSRRLADGGVTAINSAQAVYINQDEVQTGANGLTVWDGSPAAGASAGVNAYGSIDSTGVRARAGRAVLAYSANEVDYIRIIQTATGYLDSSTRIGIRSAADEVRILDSAYNISFMFDTSAGLFLRGATQLLSSRKTGWGAPTGTATRSTFATSTVTLEQLAQRVKALIDDLGASSGHGLIDA